MSKRKKRSQPRPGIKKPKGYTVPKMGEVTRHLSHDEYMLQVVTLKDTDGNVIHVGTRWECVQVARQRHEAKMKLNRLKVTSKAWS